MADEIDTNIDAAKADIQAMIDAHEAKAAAVYADRDSLKSQIAGLQTQLRAVEAAIKGGETFEIKKGRATVRILNRLKNATDEQKLRIVGI